MRHTAQSLASGRLEGPGLRERAHVVDEARAGTRRRVHDFGLAGVNRDHGGRACAGAR